MATKPLALVTGPSGYVGAHVLAALLNAGYRVRGTLRSERHIAFLKSKYPAETASGDLSFTLVPDLQAAGALDDAVRDVDYIAHVASPYFLSAADPWRELVLPAVEGTRNVLAAAAAAPRLKRIVVLSSFAAVVDFNQPSRPGYVYSESDWDTVTEEQARASGAAGYFASKTFAERAAWDLHAGGSGEGTGAAAKPGWDLVTLNPPMIYGPPVHEVDAAKGVDGLGTSLRGLLDGIRGADPDASPRVATPRLAASVDVRDVAAAHVKAFALPQGTSGRFLLCQGLNYLEDGLGGLRARGEQGLGEEGERIDRSGHFSLDVGKAEGVLGLQWTPFAKTLEDTWDEAKRLGVLKV